MELSDLIEVNDYGGRCLTRMIRGNNLTIEDWIHMNYPVFFFSLLLYIIFFI